MEEVTIIFTLVTWRPHNTVNSWSKTWRLFLGPPLESMARSLTLAIWRLHNLISIGQANAGSHLLRHYWGLNRGHYDHLMRKFQDRMASRVGPSDGELHQLIRMLMGWPIEGPLDLVDTSSLRIFPGDGVVLYFHFLFPLLCFWKISHPFGALPFFSLNNC